MATSIGQGIKYEIINYIRNNGEATWSNTVTYIANKMSVHPMYVERQLGQLVQSKQLERHEGRGFPTYSLLSGPPTAPEGIIQGKYDSYSEKRLEIIKNPENPLFEDIKGPRAV